MPTISFNDEPLHIDQHTRLSDLLAAQENLDEPYAVALNAEFVPRSQYQDILLSDGDSLDILSPVGGG